MKKQSLFLPLSCLSQHQILEKLINKFCEIFVFLHFWAQNILLVKNPNSPFYLLFNACHQVQFQKNLTKISTENFKIVDLGPKNDRFIAF